MRAGAISGRMSDHLTPLDVCAALIGPLSELERIAGYQPKAAYAWRRSSTTRPGGDLPSKVQRALLAHAEARGIPLTAEHLVRGASRAEIDAILASRAEPMRAAE